MDKAPFMTYESIQPPELNYDLYDSPLNISDWATGISSSGIPIVKKNPTPIELSPTMSMNYDSEDSDQNITYSMNEGVKGNPKKAMEFFINKGLSPQAAAGIVGNLHGESSLNTGAIGDNGTSIGMAQWHKQRADNLKEFAKKRKTDWKDFDTQLEFLWNELNTDYVGVLNQLKFAKSVDNATDIFLERFERPADPDLSRQKRRNFAKSLLK